MQRFNNKIKYESAFTLMELVVAIMIGSILIPSLVIALGHTAKKGSETLTAYKDAEIADSILRRKINELMSLPYTDSALNIASNKTFDTYEQNFTGNYTVSYVNENLASSASDAGYKKINLKVITPRGKEYAVNAYVSAWK